MNMNDLFEFMRSIDKDLINSGFELAGGFFALNHCRVLFEDKETRGVSLVSAAFFASWGFWNLVYYTALTQPLSFYAAIFLSSANTVYMGMMVYYRHVAETKSWLRSNEEIYLAPERVGLGDKS